MCGRAYSTYTDEELELRYLNEKRKRSLGELKPNYNLAPTQNSPVVLIRDGETRIELMRFGLVPSWAKDIKDASKYSLINAKAEEIEQKRSYKGPFENRRCIVPVSGFYEWKKSDHGPKHPFAIHLKNELIMSLAGVWEHWSSKVTGEEVNSFSIITTNANVLMENIHNRMPVILDRRDEQRWLDPGNHDLKSLKTLLKPCPSEWLEAYEISTLVNSPKNNSKELLVPADKR